MLLLAGDVGGTKTRAALFSVQGGKIKLVREQRFPSKTFPGLAAILKEFLASDDKRPDAACFGVAGPVANNRCEGTNLPWIIDAKLLEKAFCRGPVRLINDLEATAYGIEMLPPGAFTALQKGKPVARAPIAVIAAGTGLGEAALVWEGGGYHAVASEGGHADFAPRTVKETELLRYLSKKFGHVSYERVLSGPGKLDLYYFLRQQHGNKQPGWLSEAMMRSDPTAVVSEMAVNKKSPLCVEALELFVSIYGAEAGNLALKFLARGGVYIGGGIAPTILPLLKEGAFMESFLDKGRLSALLAQIPVQIILDDRAALFGAGHFAMRIAANGKHGNRGRAT